MGIAFGALLLGLGLVRQDRGIQQAALGALVLSGLAAGLAYLTGEGAEEAIERTVGAGKPYLERHEEAGMVGLVAAGVVGVLALIALVGGRQNRPLSRGLLIVNLGLALAASGALAWVANLGGQIGHPEIRSGQVAPSGGQEVGE
ncbi:MAG TPA: hypothetical protein VJN95_17320 [Gemmatimonadales bacterium]|nr:hypothetical protein [Gemmatimonadales bacterium]